MESDDVEKLNQMAMILTGIFPRAVRAQFDKEFSPVSLGRTMRNYQRDLNDLKTKRIINQSQWNLILPKDGNPQSTNFDVTLMITLLRHLAIISVIDTLPPDTDTSIGADLSRIKYYRNQLAHLTDAKVDSQHYDDMWNSSIEAIKRLGGESLFDEAQRLKSKILDPVQWNIRELDDNLVSEGTYKSYENTVYLTGACNVGKSTLASVFIGQKVPLQWKSTDGLMIYFGQNGIDLSEEIMVPLKEDLNLFSKVVRGKPDVKKARPDKDVYVDYVDKASHRHDNITSNYGESSSFSAATRHKSSVEIECYRLTDEFFEGLKDGKYTLDIAPSDLVDFGGQRSFDMTHQLFIRQNGTFVFMFDGRHGFLEYLPEYHVLKMTNEDIVKHWVNSVLTYCVRGQSILPMILFAATHSDHFNEEELKLKEEEYLEILRGYFGSHPMKDHICLDAIYFINATQPMDDGVKKLQDRLVKIAMTQPTWGKRMPVKWVPLEMQMAAMKRNHEYIVSKENIMKANALNGDLALPADQLEEFLGYHHSTGKITYFNQAGLDEFVVLYPPALVNILRAFITDRMFWPEGKIFEILGSMYMTGGVSKQHLEEIWSQEWVPIKSTEISDFVIKLLVHLDVLIIPQQYRDSVMCTSQNANIYFVPCIVTDKLPFAILADKGTFEERTLCLVFSMKTPLVPPALAYKMIGAVSSIWPLKEENGKTQLFQFGAVLNIDSENEMQIFVQNNEIITYLTNKTSAKRISPDVAASIQECLANTFDYALSFFYTMGNEKITFHASEFYEIKVGEVCNNQPCVLTVSEAVMKREWSCRQGRSHRTDIALRWVFDRKQKLDCCPEGCNGLSSTDMNQLTDDWFLIRLADTFSKESFKDLMTNLGLTTDEQKDLQEKWTEPLILKFMGFVRWRNKNTTFSSIPDLAEIQTAFSKIGDNRHHFCQVLRNPLNAIDFATLKIQDIPDDTVLKNLARKIGNSAIHLGIELRLDLNDIENIIYKHPKCLFDQNEDVLLEWKKQFGSKATILCLMEAASRIQKGITYLRETYLDRNSN